ncbi:MAG: metalloregulator ArsR/SmtB family transcription factor [Actinobacteria bacterium]|nr:metalloregulator ArsR/SmtB family transcription factor [Actinomycetota bacterium]MBU4302414.1 metalloregulator ArsR/SmtB family transcription factor [Actinomycetota bacterium]MBU4385446.1 metalloregulator ArsR/SmtB family transcription factor [Actinomycetota bacterium]MBU4489760.1 metalloregulator ArsR/SmtB family transcription factor [Actinomycetota bacterium]
MTEQAEAFRALADDTRLRILNLLLNTGSELCCCELTDSLEEPQYNVSKHLKILRQAGLIEGGQEGRWVYYSVPKKPDAFRKGLLDSVRSLPETRRLKKDAKNLDRRLSLRHNGKCTLGVLHGQPSGDKNAA